MTPESYLLPLLDRIGWSIPLFVVAFGAVWFAKVLYQWTERFSFAHELTEKDNPAFGTALAGYLIGATIAVVGAFPGQPAENVGTLLSAIGAVVWQGLLAVVLMRISIWLVGRFVLYKFGVDNEMVRSHNVGAGTVLAGGSIAAGLVIHGALSGESDSAMLAVRDLLVFWAAGQVVLLAGAWLYIHTVRFDVEKVIQENNVAAGISLGGFLAAVGIIVNAALSGASSDLGSELLITLVCSLIGLGSLVFSAIIGGWLFLPHSPVSKEIAVDKNPAAGLISAAAFIAAALLLARVIAV